MKTEIGCFFDDWGNYMGSLLIVAPMVWDIIGTGFRGFFEWNIDTLGIISQLIGVAVILFTRWIRISW